jgi:hypothetical protein
MTAPNQPPSGSSSVLKVLGIIFLVLLLLGIALFGSCMYCVVSNPEMRKAGSIMGEAMRMSMEANKAPGAAELRAAGCDEAMIMDMRPLLAKVEELEKEGGEANFQKPDEEWQKTTVLCHFAGEEAGLDCAAVAKAFGEAVETPPEMFAVTVQVGTRGREPACQGVYRPDGTLVMEIEQDRNALRPMQIDPSPTPPPVEDPEPEREPPSEP